METNMRQYETRVPMTETQTLEALLRQWAELEPERCRVVTGQNSGHTYEVFRLFITPAGDDYEFDTGNECFYEIEIQGTVQKAIEARGWVWSVRGHGTHAVAWVWLNIQSGDHETTTDTPAAALLSAYLQALEAQKQ